MKHEFCNNCKFLSLTEEKQNKYKLNKKNHYCNLYNKTIFHKEYHPKLPRLDECMRTNHNFELDFKLDEKVYGIILSKNISDILEKISKARKKTYAEIIERLLLEEDFRHQYHNNSNEHWQRKVDSTNTFIAEGHYNHINKINGDDQK